MSSASSKPLNSQIPDEQLLGQTEQHLSFISDRIAINKGMLTDYETMVAAAQLDDINIKIASGFRNFDRQVMIWNNKFSGKTPIKDMHGNSVDINGLSEQTLIESILLYSALPGASRHHWGTDIDVYADNLLEPGYQLKLEPWEYEKQGPLAKLADWLEANAHHYGFYLPYATYQGGIAAEPWHLSYAPIANKYQHHFSIELLSDAIEKSNIFGKQCIIENLPAIAKRYINNLCPAAESLMPRA